MKKLAILPILVLLSCQPVFGARNITLPHTEDFTSSTSINDLVWTSSGNGASVTRVQGSWRGATNYVARIDPPSIASAGGGVNGGYAALGAFHFSTTNTLNVAFALNVGTTYSSSAANSGGSLINKFIDIFDPSNRGGLLGINDRGTRDSHEFGLVNSNTEEYWYKGVSTPSTTATRAGIYFDDGNDGVQDLAGEWIWLNYSVNHNTRAVILRIWDREGNYSGTHFEIPNATDRGINEIRTIGGYHNQYHPTADTNSRLLIDDLTISNNPGVISPPVGFLFDGGPVCGADYLNLCTTSGDCTTAGGYWYNDQCNVEEQSTVVNGLCGSNNGGTFSALTSTNANNCATGTVSGFSSIGQWSWTCVGANGGTNDSCSASLVVVGGGTGNAPYSPTNFARYNASSFAPYNP